MDFIFKPFSSFVLIFALLMPQKSPSQQQEKFYLKKIAPVSVLCPPTDKERYEEIKKLLVELRHHGVKMKPSSQLQLINLFTSLKETNYQDKILTRISWWALPIFHFNQEAAFGLGLLVPYIADRIIKVQAVQEIISLIDFPRKEVAEIPIRALIQIANSVQDKQIKAELALKFLKGMNCRDYFLREVCMDLLIKITPSLNNEEFILNIIQKLIEMTQSKRKEISKNAKIALSHVALNIPYFMVDFEMIYKMTTLLQHPNPEVRMIIIEAIGVLSKHLNGSRFKEALIEKMLPFLDDLGAAEHGSSALVRNKACEALGRMIVFSIDDSLKRKVVEKIMESERLNEAEAQALCAIIPVLPESELKQQIIGRLNDLIANLNKKGWEVSVNPITKSVVGMLEKTARGISQEELKVKILYALMPYLSNDYPDITPQAKDAFIVIMNSLRESGQKEKIAKDIILNLTDLRPAIVLIAIDILQKVIQSELSDQQIEALLQNNIYALLSGPDSDIRKEVLNLLVTLIPFLKNQEVLIEYIKNSESKMTASLFHAISLIIPVLDDKLTRRLIDVIYPYLQSNDIILLEAAVNAMGNIAPLLDDVKQKKDIIEAAMVLIQNNQSGVRQLEGEGVRREVIDCIYGVIKSIEDEQGYKKKVMQCLFPFIADGKLIRIKIDRQYIAENMYATHDYEFVPEIGFLSVYAECHWEELAPLVVSEIAEKLDFSGDPQVKEAIKNKIAYYFQKSQPQDRYETTAFILLDMFFAQEKDRDAYLVFNDRRMEIVKKVIGFILNSKNVILFKAAGMRLVGRVIYNLNKRKLDIQYVTLFFGFIESKDQELQKTAIQEIGRILYRARSKGLHEKYVAELLKLVKTKDILLKQIVIEGLGRGAHLLAKAEVRREVIGELISQFESADKKIKKAIIKALTLILQQEMDYSTIEKVLGHLFNLFHSEDNELKQEALAAIGSLLDFIEHERLEADKVAQEALRKTMEWMEQYYKKNSLAVQGVGEAFSLAAENLSKLGEKRSHLIQKHVVQQLLDWIYGHPQEEVNILKHMLDLIVKHAGKLDEVEQLRVVKTFRKMLFYWNVRLNPDYFKQTFLSLISLMSLDKANLNEKLVETLFELLKNPKINQELSLLLKKHQIIPFLTNEQKVKFLPHYIELLKSDHEVLHLYARKEISLLIKSLHDQTLFMEAAQQLLPLLSSRVQQIRKSGRMLAGLSFLYMSNLTRLVFMKKMGEKKALWLLDFYHWNDESIAQEGDDWLSAFYKLWKNIQKTIAKNSAMPELKEQIYGELENYFKQIPLYQQEGDQNKKIEDIQHLSLLLTKTQNDFPLCLQSLNNIKISARQFGLLNQSVHSGHLLVLLIRLLGEERSAYGGYSDVTQKIVAQERLDQLLALIVRIVDQKNNLSLQDIAGFLDVLRIRQNRESTLRWKLKNIFFKRSMTWEVFSQEIEDYYSQGFQVITYNLFTYFIKHKNNSDELLHLKRDIEREMSGIAWGEFSGLSQAFMKKYRLSVEDEISLIGRYVPIVNRLGRDYAGQYKKVKQALSFRGFERWNEVDPSMRRLFGVKGSVCAIQFSFNSATLNFLQKMCDRLTGYLEGGSNLKELLKKYVVNPSGVDKEDLKKAGVGYLIDNYKINPYYLRMIPHSAEKLSEWLESWKQVFSDQWGIEVSKEVEQMIRNIVMDCELEAIRVNYNVKLEKLLLNELTFKKVNGEEQIANALANGSRQEELTALMKKYWLQNIDANEIIAEDFILKIESFVKLYAQYLKRTYPRLLNSALTSEMIAVKMLDSLKQSRYEILCMYGKDPQELHSALMKEQLIAYIAEEIMKIFNQDLVAIKDQISQFEIHTEETDEIFYVGFFDDLLHLMSVMMTELCTWDQLYTQVYKKKYHFGDLVLKNALGRVLGVSQVQLARVGIQGKERSSSPKGWSVLALPGINLYKGSLDGIDRKRAILALLELAQRLAEDAHLCGAVIPCDEVIRSNNTFENHFIDQLVEYGWLKKVKLTEPIVLTEKLPAAFSYSDVYLIQIPKEKRMLQEELGENFIQSDIKTVRQCFEFSSSFAGGLGEIVTREENFSEERKVVKEKVEDFIEGLPQELVKMIQQEQQKKAFALRIYINTNVKDSYLKKDNQEIELVLGRDVFYEAGKLDFILLNELMAEFFVALLLEDYVAIIDAAHYNENAWFKLELFKALLNHVSYLEIFHRLHGMDLKIIKRWGERVWRKYYFIQGTLKENVLKEYKEYFDHLTAGLDAIAYPHVFKYIFNDENPKVLVLLYVHLLKKQNKSIQGSLCQIVEKLKSFDWQKQVSLAAVRNSIKEYVMPDQVVSWLKETEEGLKLICANRFIHFDRTDEQRSLRLQFISTQDELEFYSCVKDILSKSGLLTPPEVEILMTQLRNQNLFASGNRTERLQEIFKTLFEQKIGEDIFDLLIKMLTGEKISTTPFVCLLPALSYFDVESVDDSFLDEYGASFEYQPEGFDEEDFKIETEEVPFSFEEVANQRGEDWVNELFWMPSQTMLPSPKQVDWDAALSLIQPENEQILDIAL